MREKDDSALNPLRSVEKHHFLINSLAWVKVVQRWFGKDLMKEEHADEG
jgi:hypothetical protein